MDSILRDLRYSLRMLAKRPGFSVAVIITLALGIGANTAIFTVVDAALLRSLPYRNADRLVHVWEYLPREVKPQREASYPDFVDWKTNNRTFESMAGYGQIGLILNGAESSEFLLGGRVSADFFRVLGVPPLLGRMFSAGDDELGAEPTVVVTHGTWQRRFGSDPGIVGKSLTLSDESFKVIGVLPANFHYAPLGSPELFIPFNPSAENRSRRYMHYVRVIGRLKDGVSLAQAQSDMNRVLGDVAQLDPKFHSGAGATLVGLRDQIVGNVKLILLVLLIAVTLVLLIACANVANLFLVRSTARQKEMAVRVALGASRVQLARQLLIESLLLSFAGGLLGVALARVGVSLLLAAIPPEQFARMSYLREVGLDGQVLLYSLGITLLSGVVFALVPLFQVRRHGVQSTLKEGGRGSGSAVRSRLRNGLVTAEIALTVMLAIGVGLMLKSTVRLLSVDPGFDSSNLLTMRTPLAGATYAEAAKRIAFQKQLLEQLQSIPGVKNAATTGKLPLDGGGNTGTPIIDGRSAEVMAKLPESNLRTVSASYFATVGIPLLSGRTFSGQDTLDAPRSIVVNQTFVKAYFSNQDPLGHRISFVFDSVKPWNIVGVVGDENVNTLDAAVTPVIYFPYSQDADSQLNIVVRTTTEPLTLAGAVRAEIRKLDRTLPVFAVSSMTQHIEESPATFTRRYPTLLIGIFAAVALLLAAIGLYGVISYSVSQRTHELGVRIALGARQVDIFKLVLVEGLLLTIVGVAIGLAASLAMTGFLSSLLFGVSPRDPLVAATVVPVMVLVSLAACYLPTRRAAKTDPLAALRCE
ncbi:MAG TPA: ABC transporter permease [Pyrinomonadaceae bacterium]|nr:ABC transporter permease [Pyrinomonadaceae bacterium]